MTAQISTPGVTVWYDSGCPLCLREIALMRRLDRRGAIDFVDLHGAQGCPLDREEMLRRFHAREAGEPVVSGAAAFAAMWRAIPVLRPLGLIARFPPVLWLLERLYRGFLVIRPGLQRIARGAESRGPGCSESLSFSRGRPDEPRTPDAQDDVDDEDREQHPPRTPLVVDEGGEPGRVDLAGDR